MRKQQGCNVVPQDAIMGTNFAVPVCAMKLNELKPKAEL